VSESEVTIDPEHRMTKSEAEEQEKAIFDNIYDSGMRLLKIRDERGWEALDYPSFREYAHHLDDRMSLRKIYYLVEQAEVNLNLSGALGKPIHLPMKHALALKDLEPDKQVEAFQAATGSWKKGNPKLTEKDFAKVAARIAPQAKSETKRKHRDESEGWSKEDLVKDTELADHFLMIESVYGAEDTKAIKDGKVPMKRADVLYLARLPKEKIEAIQDLIFTTRWSPQDCVKFITSAPAENSTVLDLKHLCLATKAKYWSGVFGGFTVTIKGKNAAQR
jgi:hypothetical protein